MEKNRTITIKGVGAVKAEVDLVVVKLSIEKTNKDYRAGYNDFCREISVLQESIFKIGFKKGDVKTSKISISTEYENVKVSGVWKDVFVGYSFETKMSLSFDFDSQKLVEVLGAITDSSVKPKIAIEFTVKDKEAVKNRLLESAAKAAKTKAEILCNAMGVKLGDILKISYNWDEISVYSHTEYKDSAIDQLMVAGVAPDFTPDEIDLEDTATFIWEIADK